MLEELEGILCVDLGFPLNTVVSIYKSTRGAKCRNEDARDGRPMGQKHTGGRWLVTVIQHNAGKHKRSEAEVYNVARHASTLHT